MSNVQSISSDYSLEEILITVQLEQRSPRPPNYAAENRALVALAESMAQNPQRLLQQLTDLAVELCKAGSAGISLIREDADGEFFEWVALSGVYAPYVMRRTPRHFSPCGVTLDRNAPQLFLSPSRLYTYFEEAETPITEGLIVPFYLKGQAIGTIWVVGHDAEQQFDAEDVRLMTSLAKFTAAAIQVTQSLDASTIANNKLIEKINEREEAEAALSKSKAALRELNATLEQRVRERTDDLQRSNLELDQFAYVASHDLKAPLRAIYQLSSWIDEDAGHLLPATSKEYLTKLQSRVHRLETLLNDLLAYSRAGRHQHPPEEVDTAELVQNAVSILPMPANFTMRIDGVMPTIITERTPLETVFRNLIDNAIKHHHRPEKGCVEISAQDHGEFVIFSVKDNGPGIDELFYQRIFEMFQTLRPRDQVEGSGMGLTVVKKLVESRGGKIQVESSQGEGSTFRFTWRKSYHSDIDGTS
jgi:signal transduction histidine kinase